MTEPLHAASPAEEVKLRAEIVRLNKMAQALIDRAERSTSAQGADFSLFETAALLEDQVRNRMRELEATLRGDEKINRALQSARGRMEREIQERKQTQEAAKSNGQDLPPGACQRWGDNTDRAGQNREKWQ